jgi:hypothetical protein
VGRPLDALRDDVIPLPDIAGFDAPDESLLALIISHGHQDHWGLIGQVPARVPVYIGRAAQRILKEAAFFSVGVALEPAGFLSHREPFEVGPFTITPFLNDHSGFDTYSFPRAGSSPSEGIDPRDPEQIVSSWPRTVFGWQLDRYNGMFVVAPVRASRIDWAQFWAQSAVSS